MRKCRCINIIGSVFKYGEVYFYRIAIKSSKYDLYKYKVYDREGIKLLGEFSEFYFNVHFMDMIDERKLKIQKIQSN